MTKFVKLCLNEWWLKIIDSPTPNVIRVQHLDKMSLFWNNLILKDDYIQMSIYILNLIVSGWLKIIDILF